MPAFARSGHTMKFLLWVASRGIENRQAKKISAVLVDIDNSGALQRFQPFSVANSTHSWIRSGGCADDLRSVRVSSSRSSGFTGNRTTDLGRLALRRLQPEWLSGSVRRGCLSNLRGGFRTWWIYTCRVARRSHPAAAGRAIRRRSCSCCCRLAEAMAPGLQSL